MSHPLVHTFANGDEVHGLPIEEVIAQQNHDASKANIRTMDEDRRWRQDVRYLTKVPSNRRENTRRQTTGE